MADELISSYIDLAAIKGETDGMISEIQRLIDSYNSLKSAKISASTSNNQPDFSASIKQADKDTQNLIKTQRDLIAVKRDRAKLDLDLIKIRQQSNKEQSTTVKNTQLEQKQAYELANTYKQYSLAAAEASNRAKSYSLELGATHPVTIQATKDALEMNTRLKDLDATTGVYNRNVGNYSSAFTGYANTLRGLRGPTKLLGEALGIGAQEADQFRIVLEHSLQGIAAFFRGKEAKAAASTEEATASAAAAAATEAETTAQVENTVATSAATTATEAEVIANTQLTGSAARATVAVEGEAIAQAELAAATTGATAATSLFLNVLKFSGIALALAAIGLLVFKIIEYRKELSQAKEMQKLMNEVNEDAAKAAGKEVGSLQVLKAEIENTLIPMDKRLQAIKNLKDQYPDLLKNTTDEALLQGKAADSYNLVAAAILRKAQAQAAEAKIGELSAKNLDIILASTEKANEVNNKIKNAHDDAAISSGGSGGVGGNLGGVSKQAKQRAYKEEFDAQKAQDQKLIGLNNDKINILLKYAAVEDNIAKDKTTKTKKSKTGAVELQSTKESLDLEYELYKIAQDRKIKLLDEEAKNDKLSYDKRIDALNAASTARLDLIDRETAHEIEKENEKETALKANAAKQKGTQRNNTLREIENIEKQKLIIQSKAAADRLAVLDSNEKEYNAIAKQRGDEYLKLEKAKYDKAITLIEENRNNEKAASDRDYNGALDALQFKLDTGVISEKEFNKKKLDLDFAYAVESLAIEEDRIKKIIALKALTGQDVSKELLAVEDLERKIRNASIDNTKKTEKEKQKAILDTLSTIKEVGDQVFGLISGIGDAQLTAQKNALTAQQNAAEKKAARDIEIVNASVLSEQDKAAKITIINARLQAQKDQIAQREKQAQEQKARTDKAAAIFDIILSTAAAVVKALPNIPLAIGVGALGAAELALAIAAPIPKFKTGKGAGNNYEGLAIVGDGGRREVIEGADGSIRVTPDTDTLTHVKSSDIIHPDFNAWRDAMLNAAYRDANRGMKIPVEKDKSNQMERDIRKQTELLKQIADRPIETTYGTEAGVKQIIRWGVREINYIDKSTNW